MGRKIFEEKNVSLDGHVLPYDQFRLFCDREGGFAIAEEQKPRLVAEAEKWMDVKLEVLPATDFMRFRRTGNRDIYEKKWVVRREMLMALAMGEYAEGMGRFVDKIVDVLWLILEETTWVLPAHNGPCLPHAYGPEVHFIDLFSAVTAADLAVVWYLLQEQLDAVHPLIGQRIAYELERRIIKPVLSDTDLWEHNAWCGIRSLTYCNNWCPWIMSNVLTVAALTVKDVTRRTMVMRTAMAALDRFTSTYHPDGGCNEGPNYWTFAGGALFNACLVLYDMSGGYVNVYDDPLLKNMGEYIVKVLVTGERALNFGDSPPRIEPDPLLVYHWGQACGSESMMSYGKWKLKGELPSPVFEYRAPYRSLKSLTEGRLPQEELILPSKVYISGLEIAATRESDRVGQGMYLAIKGGHNEESHNHNDLGNIIVFAGERPLLIDAGAGTYTRRTFSPQRYDIWSMCSEYHNCATFTGVGQRAGGQFASTTREYDPATGKLTLDLTAAYPPEAEVAHYTRSAVLADGVVTVTDEVKLTEPGQVMFSYMTIERPAWTGKNCFMLDGRVVSYDPSLTYAIEACDKSEPETETIPAGWDTDTLWRITLTSREAVSEHTYVLTVEDYTLEKDWRLNEQMEYLANKTLSRRQYQGDHAHCEFCWQTLDASGMDGTQTEGYVTEDGKCWICKECFEDFKEMFRWNTEKKAE